MKRIILLVFMVVGVALPVVRAYDFSVQVASGQTLYFRVVSSTAPYTVRVTYPNSTATDIHDLYDGFAKPTGNLIIPSTVTYNGITYSVTYIATAFAYCNGLTSVVIPPSVTGIAVNAFRDCTSLISAEIPNSVAALDDRAFQGCTSLSDISVPNSVVSIGTSAFEGCIGLTNANIGNSIVSIGNSAFRGCSNITSITIPGSVTSILSYAFKDCISLREVVSLAAIPPTLGSDCFYNIADSSVLNTLCGHLSVYVASSDWSSFTIVQEKPYDVAMEVNDRVTGRVDLLSHSCDSTIVYAVPNRGYVFRSWDDGSTQNPRRMTLANDTSVVANFSEGVVTLLSANDSMGTVIGARLHKLDTLATVAAIPANGYRFHSWSDSSVQNPYTFLLERDTQLIAYFAEIVPETTYIYDSVYIEVHDTLVITREDTIIQTVYDTVLMHDTVYSYIYDTVFAIDTLWLFDTIYLHDTIYIKDTTTGIKDISVVNAKIYSSGGKIMVEGVEGNNVMLLDVNGRLLATKQGEYSTMEFEVPISGAYFVRIGKHFRAKKVVVIK